MEYLNNGNWEKTPCFAFTRSSGQYHYSKIPITWRFKNQLPDLKDLKHLPLISSKITINPKYITITGTYPTFANLIVEASILRCFIQSDPHDGYPYQKALGNLFLNKKNKLLKHFHIPLYDQQIMGMGHSPFTGIPLENEPHNISLKEYIKASLETNSNNYLYYTETTYKNAIKLYR